MEDNKLIEQCFPECWSNNDCEEHEWCTIDNRCQSACACAGRMDCDTWSQDGYCDGERHISVCRFYSDTDNDISPELEFGSKSGDDDCEQTYECSPDLYCHTNNKCINPCDDLLKCTTDGPDNPGFVVLRDNEEYQQSDEFSCVLQDYTLSCE